MTSGLSTFVDAATVQEATLGDRDSLLDVYALLREALGPGAVEDADSFAATVSIETDPAVVPRIVCAVRGTELVGATVGAYLAKVNVGMLTYSAVKESARRHGVYRRLRTSMIELLDRTGQGLTRVGLKYAVSELSEDGWLLDWYRRNGAYAARCDYEQPQAQGLRRRRLRLVFQPMAGEPSPSADVVGATITEIYRGVYRLREPALNTELSRVLASVGESGRNGGGGHE